MRAIRASHIEAWVKSMTAAGLAPGTMTARFNSMRAVFRAAHRDKVIGSDPTTGIALPRKRRAEVAMTIPSPADVGTILAAAEVWFRPMIGLCAFAGLRLGEAAAIKLEDIDFLRRTLTVTRQVQRVPGGIEIRPPSTARSGWCTCPTPWCRCSPEHVRTIGVRPAGWLFVGTGDGPPHKDQVSYWWRKTLTASGLSGVKLHDLRHFYASGLIAHGCDVVTVQRALGHSSATTTLHTYSHLWPTAEDRTRKASEAMMKTSAGILADSVRTEAT